jgi:hypothetical protein
VLATVLALSSRPASWPKESGSKLPHSKAPQYQVVTSASPEWSRWLEQISSLRPDKSHRALGPAPHKALLLLVVFDLAEEGKLAGALLGKGCRGAVRREAAQLLKARAGSLIIRHQPPLPARPGFSEMAPPAAWLFRIMTAGCGAARTQSCNPGAD